MRAPFILVLAFLLAWITYAVAGSGNYHATPGSGLTFDAITDSGGNLVPQFGLCDGLNGTPCAQVKGSNVAATASDQAAVVAINPGSNTVSLNGALPGFALTPSVNVNGIGATVNVNCTVGCAASSSISVTQSTVPWIVQGTVSLGTSTPSVNVIQWDGTALGAPSNYGTTPGTVSVIGANVFVTNTPNVSVTNTPAVTISGTPSVNVNGIGTPVPVTQSTTPWIVQGTVSLGASVPSVNVIDWNGNALGSPSNYGTSPGTVSVIGANVFVTNSPAVTVTGTPSVNVNGIGAMPPVVLSGTPSVVVTNTPSVNVLDWAGSLLGAPSNYGTSPGAVTVPGMNAFVTNIPSVNVANVPSVNLLDWAGQILGAPSNYGTSPGAVTVPGMNAFVTNTPSVNLANTPSVNVNGIGATVNVNCTSGCSGSAGTSSVNIIQLNGTALGNPSNYGTSPGTVSVIGANVFVTNTPAVTLSGTPSVNVNGIGALPPVVLSGTPSVNVNGIGAPILLSGTPSINMTQLDGTALGAPSNYGTSPGTVSVIGANVFVTNTPAVTLSGTPSVNVNGIGALPPVVLSGTPSVNVNGIGAPIQISGTPSVNVNGIGALVNIGTVAQVPSGAQAVNIEPAKATVSAIIAPIADLAGKQIMSPYAGREVQLRGQNTATSTTLATIISAQSGYKLYVTDVACGRTDTGTTAITVTFNDTVSTQLVIPNSGGGGGNNKTYNTPLVLASGVTLQYAMSTNTSSVACGATGFFGY